MDPKVKQEWIDALRSDYYKQGKYQLHELGDLYDATGVLCDLAVRAGVIGQPQKFDKDNSEFFFGYLYGDAKQNDRYGTGLPKAVQEWSGVEYRAGYKVAMMGDYGKTFNEIANYIQQTL